MKRAVVTGATGFVGANLARRLLADGHEVHLLVRPGHFAWRIDDIRRDVRLHEVLLTDEPALVATLERIRPDWVFHLAVHGAYSWQLDLPQMVQTNVVGTTNLVQASLRIGVEALVNAGSSSEYGVKDHAPSELEFVDPNSYYAVTKAWSTMFCRFTAMSRGARLSTLRLYSVYGPWEEPRRLLPTLILHGLRGALPPLVSPETVRDYVHVDDAVDAFLLAAERPEQQPGAVYNVGMGVQTTLGEVVEVARRVLGITAEPVWGTMPARQWDTSVWVSDNRAIRDALGWQPRLAFEDGFRRMVDWFRERPGMQELYARLAAGRAP
jgi:UDP-glucose 4-epimerase